jgi:hypothetical protein
MSERLCFHYRMYKFGMQSCAIVILIIYKKHLEWHIQVKRLCFEEWVQICH